ncbi:MULTISPECIES: hypothetical protein [Corynebacterium]|uniref:Secreted protein n=2 Tax=Corynebacterium glucuronolyticum TaxID=39791 RepID=A0A7T4EH04_9CORY|nr:MULTISPECIES: hypothetical protein [Corynebacterium]EEI64188.1 hypothetical protein HMPREF0293_0275 [Corynebacterium glucuronolyticum ATCC 51866]MCT1442063.1 hypothetical protein [Corynebacterium glucuronolyticum]MCT1563570.1 hypothetical protein [Corynebacterium glucuronolyticum]OFO46324.1 hypothetical protein HMPREF3044_10810 [Corynebacterium sp. HMSC073D01]QQB47201.1 hypothetical protein I6I10_04645 [Corynebacterium glucuronolyticum]
MKLRAIASATVLSVALAGGSVVAPTAGAETPSWGEQAGQTSSAFLTCGSVLKAVAEKGGRSDEWIEANWDSIKEDMGSKGSSAPGDFSTLCFESGLASDDPELAAASWSLLIFLILLGVGAVSTVVAPR